MEIFSDRRFRIVLFLSISVSLVGCAFLSWFAGVRGLDPISLTGDSKGYIYLAENILEHQVFSAAQSEPFYPESFRAPGYPAFLAVLFALFGTSVVALFVHALIASIAPVLLYLIFLPIHERAAFWAAIIFTLEPVRIYLSASFLSDAFFTLIFLASLLCLMRIRNPLVAAVSAGALLGIAILVRPIAMFLPILYVLYVLATIRPWKTSIISAALLCIVSAAVVFPWMYRNHQLFDSWNVSSVGSANLMLYNAPEFLKWNTNPDTQALLDSFREEQAALSREEALSLARSAVFTDTFREIIRGNEVSYIFFHFLKTAPFFLTDGLRDTVRLFGVDIGTMPNISTALMRGNVGLFITYVSTGGLAIALFIIGTGFWGIITLLFGLETLRAAWRREWLPTIFLASLVVYFALLTGPVSNARYRVPVEGLMFFVALSLTHRLIKNQYPHQ
ncbi:MAG: glycosyltransferase family 39 protein [Minisyncoccia bacterium]